MKNNPLSFLRVVKPEVDLSPDIDLYSKTVYQQGAKNLRRLMEDGLMNQDKDPGFYFYRQIMGDHSQTGLVACVSAEDYDNDVIKKHESQGRQRRKTAYATSRPRTPSADRCSLHTPIIRA